MSVLSDNNNNKKDKDYVAIRINDSSVSYPPSSKLFCNLCSCNLILAGAQKEEWFCTRCNVSYFLNKGERVKRANKLSTPGPLTDSMVDNAAATYLKPKKSIFPKSLDMLKRGGINITSFSSTVDG